MQADVAWRGAVRCGAAPGRGVNRRREAWRRKCVMVEMEMAALVCVTM